MGKSLVAVAALLGGISGAQAAVATFEGHFTSRSVLDCSSGNCTSTDSVIDVTLLRSTSIAFDATATPNGFSFSSFGRTYYSALQFAFQETGARTTDYAHPLLAPAFGPVPISQAAFDSADRHFFGADSVQTLTREVSVDDATGTASGGAASWLVGASQSWITFDLTAGTARSWSEQLNFNLRRPLPLGPADVQRAWTAGEFWSFVQAAAQPGDVFSAEVVQSLQDDAAGPQPTIYYRGTARLVSLEGVPAIPEPGSAWLLLAGGAALVVARRRR